MADFPLQFPRDAAASGHVGRAATTAALARGKFGNRAQLSVRAAAPHARARVRSDEEVRRDSHAEFAEVIEVIVFCKNEFAHHT